MRIHLKLFREPNHVKELELDAAGVQEAREIVTSQGWVVLSSRPLGIRTPGRRAGEKFPLLLFSQELHSLLDAGLSLVEAIEALRDKEADAMVRRVLSDLVDSLRMGSSFSKALQRYDEVFPPLFRAAVEASEQTGEVGQALARFNVYEQQFRNLRSRLGSALLYPALLTVLGGLVALFLLTYVVPRFSVVFVDRLEHMPVLSGLVIRTGLFISNHPWGMAIFAVASLCAMGYAVTRPSFRNWLVGYAWKLPLVGHQLHQYQMARLYRSLGLLLRAGIPALKAMGMARVVLGVAGIDGMERAMTMVREGSPLSQALKEQGLSGSVADRLLAAGERSGRMGEMLERAADFLDDEVARFLDRVVRLAEPLMMVVIGVIVGGIVMLMYLPIFELADSVR